jgi:hypothetical protein
MSVNHSLRQARVTSNKGHRPLFVCWFTVVETYKGRCTENICLSPGTIRKTQVRAYLYSEAKTAGSVPGQTPNSCDDAWRAGERRAMHSFGSLSLGFNNPYANCILNREGEKLLFDIPQGLANWRPSLQQYVCYLEQPPAITPWWTRVAAQVFVSLEKFFLEKISANVHYEYAKSVMYAQSDENVWYLLYGFKRALGGGSRRFLFSCGKSVVSIPQFFFRMVVSVRLGSVKRNERVQWDSNWWWGLLACFGKHFASQY